MDRTVRDAIETELHPYNMNREGGFCVSKSWKPVEEWCLLGCYAVWLL
jgi:hypothetical protein